MEKESEKEYIYIYKLNHFAVHLKLTKYCKSTIFQKNKQTNKQKQLCIVQAFLLLSMTTQQDCFN